MVVWDDMDAVRAFAGDDPETAVFYPENRFLIERDLVSYHYEVVAAPSGCAAQTNELRRTTLARFCQPSKPWVGRDSRRPACLCR